MGNVGKTMPFAPSPKSRSIGGMFTIPKWAVDYCFTHINYIIRAEAPVDENPQEHIGKCEFHRQKMWILMGFT